MNKLLVTLPILLALTGCETLNSTLSNRVSMSLACDTAFVVSQYGPVGISSKIDPKDHEALKEKFCK